MTTVNFTTLAKENPTSEALVRYLESRQRHRPDINLDILERGLLRSGETIVHRDMIEFFKKLDLAGVGRLVQGRGENASVRFELHKHLGKLVEAEKADSKVTVEAIPDAPNVEVQAAAQPAPTRGKGGRRKGSKNKPKNNDVIPLVSRQEEVAAAPAQQQTGKKAPTEKQLAARQKFGEQARMRAEARRQAKKNGTPMPSQPRKKQAVTEQPVVQQQTLDSSNVAAIAAAMAGAMVKEMLPKLLEQFGNKQ